MPRELCFKIILIGDSGVGKSTVISRLKGERFIETGRMETLEVEKSVKSYNIGGVVVKLELWDTPGSDERRTLAAFSYQGAQGIIAFYDFGREETLGNVEHWLRLSSQYVSGDDNGDVKVLLVGNKCDKKTDNFSDDGLKHLCEKYKAKCYEISAKHRDTSRIEEMFREYAESISQVQVTGPQGQNGEPVEKKSFCSIV